MAYQEIYRQSWTNPTSTAIISIETIRNGTQITVNAKIDCILTYSNGYINYDGDINFNTLKLANSLANLKPLYVSENYSKNTKIDRKSITYACKGIYKQAGGYIWRYALDYQKVA